MASKLMKVHYWDKRKGNQVLCGLFFHHVYHTDKSQNITCEKCKESYLKDKNKKDAFGNTIINIRTAAYWVLRELNSFVEPQGLKAKMTRYYACGEGRASFMVCKVEVEIDHISFNKFVEIKKAFFEHMKRIGLTHKMSIGVGSHEGASDEDGVGVFSFSFYREWFEGAK